MDRFGQRKKGILEKRDKSSKGNWDSRIIKLCNKINSSENYYTTSSCSGRVVILKNQVLKEKGMFFYVSHELVNSKNFFEGFKGFGKANFKFKQDPFILHVACKNIESAKRFLSLGLRAGFKRSVILNLGKNIIIEFRGTEKLEFPLLENGKLLVTKVFLKKVFLIANKNLERGWERIVNLENLLEEFFKTPKTFKNQINFK